MEYHSLLIKYGEIGIKGKNRFIFEDTLVRRILEALAPLPGEFSARKEQGRIYIDLEGAFDFDDTVHALQHVFGIVGICPVRIVQDEGIEQLKTDVVNFVREAYDRHDQSFKVVTRRARKNYPIPSMEVNAILGESLLENFQEMQVDVHEPELTLHVEIR